jgi:hypothetical protein
MSPDQRFIVSVGTEGAIFLWKTPEEVSGVPAQTQEVRAENVNS